MKKTGIFYGSTSGATRRTAEKIRDLLGKKQADLHDIKNIPGKELENYHNLILGTSSWGIGDMQDDWEDFFEKMGGLDLTGKKIALFGLGDQKRYPESFADGLGMLYCRLPDKSNVVGSWPLEGYHYHFSMAEKEGSFVGLVLDEDAQPELSDERIRRWVALLREQLL